VGVRLKRIGKCRNRKMADRETLLDIENSRELITCNTTVKDEAVPIQALRVPGGSQISNQCAREGCNVVSVAHRPPFTQRKVCWYSLLLEAELNPEP
jgi:hypothetical protein